MTQNQPTSIAHGIFLLALLWMAQGVFAQTPHVSHRVIPPAQDGDNSFDLKQFMTPELKELRSEYLELLTVQQEDRRLRDERRQQRLQEYRIKNPRANAPQSQGTRSSSSRTDNSGSSSSRSTNSRSNSDRSNPTRSTPSGANSSRPGSGRQPAGERTWGGQFSSSPAPSPESVSPVTAPPAAREDLQRVDPATRELIEDLWLPSRESSRQAIDEEVASVAEQLNDELGKDFGITEDKLPAISTDDVSTVREMQKSLRRMLSEAKKKQDEFIRKAQRAAGQWPMQNVPPADWIEKVQPFINPELVNQIREVNAAAQEAKKQGKSPDSVFKTLAQKKKPADTGILNSVMKSIEATGTEWVKSRKATPPDKKKSSWWKQLAGRSQRQLKDINKSITDNSRSRASEKASWSERFSDVFEANDATNDLANNQAGQTGWSSTAIVSLIGILLLAGLGILYRYRGRIWPPRDEVTERGRGMVPSDSIHDRDSLLQACHRLSLSMFGKPSRFWNHREVFDALEARLRDDAATVSKLADIYEHARYSGAGQFTSPEDLRTARRLFESIQRAETVSA